MGDKTRIVGGADSGISVALMEGLKAARHLAEQKGVPNEEFDKTVLPAVSVSMDQSYDMTAPGPKGQMDKIYRRYHEPWAPPPKSDDYDWLDDVEGTLVEDVTAEATAYMVEAERHVTEYARRGQPNGMKLGMKFYVKKAEISGGAHIVVGTSFGEYGGMRCHANGALEGKTFDKLPKTRAVYDGNAPLEATKSEGKRLFRVYVLPLVAGRKFYLWWNLAGMGDGEKHYFTMRDNAAGYDYDKKRSGVLEGFTKLDSGLIVPAGTPIAKINGR